MATCTDCTKGPRGIAGHDELFSHTMTPAEMHFRCRACGQLWARRPKGDAFAWERIERTAGNDVPGRPGTAPP